MGVLLGSEAAAHPLPEPPGAPLAPPSAVAMAVTRQVPFVWRAMLAPPTARRAMRPGAPLISASLGLATVVDDGVAGAQLLGARPRRVASLVSFLAETSHGSQTRQARLGGAACLGRRDAGRPSPARAVAVFPQVLAAAVGAYPISAPSELVTSAASESGGATVPCRPPGVAAPRGFSPSHGRQSPWVRRRSAGSGRWHLPPPAAAAMCSL
jgi:hypothetical protein